jgi:hypothetical protein
MKETVRKRMLKLIWWTFDQLVMYKFDITF